MPKPPRHAAPRSRGRAVYAKSALTHEQLIERVRSRGLGVNDPLLISWLRTYNRVRNICAHHGRLWNVGLGVYPALPTAQTVPWLADRDTLAQHPDRAKRIYPVLVSIQAVLVTVSPHSSWAHRHIALVEAHPNLPLRGMGLFPGWSDDAFWNSQPPASEAASS